MKSPAFAEIVLPVPVERSFSYAVPEALQDRIQVGMRAIVPVQKRVETGYVVGVSPTCDFDAPKPILDLPDTLPVFSPAMLKLCKWMSEYYCASWGEALQCAVPAGMRMNSTLRYRLEEQAIHTGRFTERQKKVIGALYSRGPLTEGQLAGVVGRASLSNTLQSLTKRGVLHAEPVMKGGGASIQTETWVVLVKDSVPDGEALMALQRRAPKQAAVYLDLLHNTGEAAATELYAKHGVNSSVLKTLEEKGLVQREEREFYRSPDLGGGQQAADKFDLNGEQQAAYDAIDTAMSDKAFQTFLLHGITGSGKTEVYLQAIERVLALGRDAIILVPEISLTPQTVGRFFARFKEDIAVLHSGLSTGERFDEWRRAQRGEVRIVVGARSAIFAPLPDVGIIVVDEEHDSSYKQGETPRYHARDVAIMRAKLNDAVCVLGSATPSIESYYNSENGKSTRLNLLTRATSGSLPKVDLVDMRVEAKEASGKNILSRELEAAVKARVAEREQVILLLNRRGFAPYVLCPQCGWVAECENCQVSLTYHQQGGVLRCHYCDEQQPKPQVCGECHFNPLIFVGSGTQRAEDYLMRTFENARVARMDADTTAGKGGHAKILGRFAEGDIDILIGTQMLAKGHDYPGVTLVGVINADTGLALPDFRAAEQSFQLLTQVAGRAGRGDKQGEVLIQTFRPKHYAVQAASTHDYHRFYAEEIEHRRGAGYPPFRRMANFLVEATDAEQGERAVFQLRKMVGAAMEELGFGGMEILGPSPAVVKRVNKKYRWHMAILSKSSKRINTLTREARMRFQKQYTGKSIQLKVDLDPYGMY